MDNKCLAIGVGDAPPLDYLRGAVNGAHEISSWAIAQGYDTRLLTDEKNPIGIDEVRNELNDLLVGGARRLLLYFAGHGLSTGASNDLWLLSQWNHVRRGVAVSALRNRLMRYGIEQLVLVSDACRSPVDYSNRDVQDDPVLHRGDYDERIPQMDLWFSASPSRAAWMVPGRTPGESRCVFSGLLAEALSGKHVDAFDPQNSPPLGITNFSLADFMEIEVPKLAARYGATLNPAVTTAIRPPNHIYASADGLPDLNAENQIPWPDPSDSRITSLGNSNGESRLAPKRGESWTTLDAVGNSAGLESLNRAESRVSENLYMSDVILRDTETKTNLLERKQDDMSWMLSRLNNEQRPTRFDSESGFSVSGAFGVRAFLGASATAVEDNQFSPDTNWWRVEQNSSMFHDGSMGDAFTLKQPHPLLIELADGRWIGAAVLPGYILSFTLDTWGAESVIFRSIDNPSAPETETAMAELRAGALGKEQAPDLLARLRRGKHADPILGVLASYLHEAMGDIANVHRTAYYFAERGDPIPFDIALLGHLVAHRNDDGLVHVEIPSVKGTHGSRSNHGYLTGSTPSSTGVVAGAFPWMRQGWLLLDPEGRPGLYPATLSSLGEHLLSSPFTTLDAAGGLRLADLLR